MRFEILRRLGPVALVVVGGVAAGLGCAKPKPDPDGVYHGAVPLALDQWHSEQLYCKIGDCSDWYRIELPERGDLQVDVVAPQGVARNFTLSLADANADILTRTASAGTGRAQVFSRTQAGTHLIEITTSDKGRQVLAYDVQARYEPDPPTPPPAPPDLLRSEVIEIEGAGEPEAVLIGRGEDAGLQAGQPGRLLDRGDEIGRVEVQDVYPEGSRLRIDGSLSAPITHTTMVEIELPAGTLSDDGAEAPSEER